MTFWQNTSLYYFKPLQSDIPQHGQMSANFTNQICPVKCIGQCYYYAHVCVSIIRDKPFSNLFYSQNNCSESEKQTRKCFGQNLYKLPLLQSCLKQAAIILARSWKFTVLETPYSTFHVTISHICTYMYSVQVNDNHYCIVCYCITYKHSRQFFLPTRMALIVACL